MEKNGRTERATPEKRRKSRAEGNIAKSKDVTNLLDFAAIFLFFLWMSSWIASSFVGILQEGFAVIAAKESPSVLMLSLSVKAGELFGAIAGTVIFFQILNQFFQTRFLLSWKKIMPSLSKLNPSTYFSGIWTARSWVDVGKSLLILVLLFYVVYSSLSGDFDTIANAILLPWQSALSVMWGMFQSVLLKIVIALFVVAAVDYAFQKWNYEQSIKMTKEEVKDERKNQEGNPEVKGRQKKAMYALLKGSLDRKIPDATLILTNPTHYSVAVRYKKGVDASPRVIAKGEDEVAMLIREIAQVHNIPLYENPPLTRALYAKVDENEYIPPEFWIVMIEILNELIAKKKIRLD